MKESTAPKGTWITTYGDMVTLLLTFFILMIVILNEAESNIYKMLDMLLSETEQKLDSYVAEQALDKNINIQRTTKGVQLTVSGEYFFDINSAQITAALRPLLDHIGHTIQQSRLLGVRGDPELKGFHDALRKSNHHLNVEIRVEGHTDNWTIRGGRYASNWELSSARALEVVKYLSAVSGVEEGKFSALGYGEFRPITSNETPEGRSKNRRVEIFIDADITPINGN
ncbi:flagellar motor protein MotB [bacterium]|nr:flagellar motor protein MotB [bacterium]MBU1063600.1 flagellar motor protein MotB [bacterium]MBU1635698.1 flagellar motor protein MotB [bacterium]MBU1874535.1 flagellar motor protein MotB [bacterium]